MYLNILKKDLKRKKTMNFILFIFTILASTFIASSINNLTAITTALDGYFEKAEMPDYWIATTDVNEQFNKFAEENNYEYKTLELLQVNPHNILVEDKIFEYGNTTSFSTLKNSTKVFDSSENEITKVNDGELYIPSYIMNDPKYDLHIGDIITVPLAAEGETIKFTLKGSSKDAAFGSTMMGITRMLISENDFELLKRDNSDTIIYSVFVNTDDSDFIEKFNRLETNTIMTADRQLMKTMYIMDMLMAVVILIVSVCLILIAMVILRFTINFTMSEEFREIGVMKAIGIRNGSIRGFYIVKYFAVSVVGSAVGFVLSIPFGKMLIKDVSKNVILGSSDRIWLNLICSAVSGAVVVWFCYLCTGKIKKFSPIDAIRNGENGERYSRKGFIHLGKTHVPTTVFMALNDILSGFKRFAVMAAIFTLGLLLIQIPQNTINTLQSDNLITWFNMSPSDHVISVETLFGNGNNEEMLYDKVNGVKAFLAEKNIKADVFQEIMFKSSISFGDKITTSLSCQGIGDVTVDDYMYDEGSAPKNINEVAITSLVAQRIGAEIGDDIVIKNGDKSKTYTVCALYQSMNNMGEGVRFHHDEKLDYDHATGSFGIQIKYTDDPDSKILSERKALLSERYTDGKIYNAGEYINYMIGDVAGQMDSIKYLIVIVVLAINILVTVLMVKSFITKEKGEIAILKAIGFKSGSLIAWQTIRLGIIILIAAVAASTVSVPLTNLAVEPVFGIMGAQSIEFEIKGLEVFVLYPLIILLFTTLSGMLTALQIRKISSSEISNVE